MKKTSIISSVVVGLPLLIWAGGTLLAEGHFPGTGKLVDDNTTNDLSTLIALGMFWVVLPAVCAGIGALVGVVVVVTFRCFVGFCHIVSTTFGGRKMTTEPRN